MSPTLEVLRGAADTSSFIRKSAVVATRRVSLLRHLFQDLGMYLLLLPNSQEGIRGADG